MADDFAAVARWVENLEKAVGPAATRRILTKAGAAGKKSALEAASSSLGGDRRFSNWKGKPALSAGYDSVSATEVTIKFRPSGMWRLAEAGRHSSGAIFPRRGGRKGRGPGGGRGGPAVRTPAGPRARSSYGRSRGLKTYSTATRKASTTVPKAAHQQFVAEIRRAV